MVKSIPVSILSLIFLTVLSFVGPNNSFAEVEFDFNKWVEASKGTTLHDYKMFDTQICETHLISKNSLKQFSRRDAEYATIDFLGEMPGEHGGRLVLLFKNPMFNSWRSRFSIGAAKQGDPRAPVSLFGPLLTHFFGIRQISEDVITIPDVDEVNGAIKKLNTALIELGFQPIPFKYYEMMPEPDEQDPKKRVKILFDFIEKATAHFLWPFSIRQKFPQIHDVSYHLAMLMLPVHLLEQFKSRYSLVTKFYYFINTQIELNDNLRLSYLWEYAHRLDAGLGHFQVPAFLRIADEKKKKYEENLEKGWDILMKANISNAAFVEIGVSNILGWRSEESERVEKIFKSFLTQEQQGNLKQVFTITGSELSKALKSRHDEIIKALMYLQRKKHE